MTRHPTISFQKSNYEIDKVIDRTDREDSTDEDALGVPTFEEELEKLDMPDVSKDFLEYLLVADYKRRPTAAEALESTQFEALAG